MITNGTLDISNVINVPIYATASLGISSAMKAYLILKAYDVKGSGRISVSEALEILGQVSGLSQSALYELLYTNDRNIRLWTRTPSRFVKGRQQSGFLYLKSWRNISSNERERVIQVSVNELWASLGALCYMGIQYDKQNPRFTEKGSFTSRKWISNHYFGVDERTTRRWCRAWSERTGLWPQEPTFVSFEGYVGEHNGEFRHCLRDGERMTVKQVANTLNGRFDENPPLSFRMSGKVQKKKWVGLVINLEQEQGVWFGLKKPYARSSFQFVSDNNS